MSTPQDWLAGPDGIAHRLRRLRESTGLRGTDFAEHAGWVQSKVSRLENGQQMPSAEDVAAYVRICGADEITAAELTQVRDRAQDDRSTWRRRLRAGQARQQGDYNHLVDRSTTVRHLEVACVPGLLQTPAYARNILTEVRRLHELTTDDLAAAVTERLRRQQRLYDPAKQFEFLLTEAALRWQLCPPPDMRAQLDRLQTMVGMQGVRFGVLPFDRPPPITPLHSFTMYDDLVLIETYTGEIAHRGPAATRYAQILDDLWVDAATGDDARQIIVEASRALPG